MHKHGPATLVIVPPASRPYYSPCGAVGIETAPDGGVRVSRALVGLRTASPMPLPKGARVIVLEGHVTLPPGWQEDLQGSLGRGVKVLQDYPRAA